MQSLFYGMSMVISGHKEGDDSDTKKKKKKRMSHMDLIIPAIKNIPPKKGRTDL